MITEKDVPKELLNNIQYFITGSVRFGTQKEGSDIDIAILIMDRTHVHEIASSISTPEYSNYNNGFKLNIEAGTINFIPLHPLDYITWFHAAKIMEIYPNKKDKEKSHLHGIHQIICGLIKTTFSGKLVNSKNFDDFLNDSLNDSVENNGIEGLLFLK